MKLVFSSREARWKFAARIAEFQDELRWSKKKIASLERSLESKSIIDPIAEDSPMAILPISIRLPPIGSSLHQVADHLLVLLKGRGSLPWCHIDQTYHLKEESHHVSEVYMS